VQRRRRAASPRYGNRPSAPPWKTLCRSSVRPTSSAARRSHCDRHGLSIGKFQIAAAGSTAASTWTVSRLSSSCEWLCPCERHQPIECACCGPARRAPVDGDAAAQHVQARQPRRWEVARIRPTPRIASSAVQSLRYRRDRQDRTRRQLRARSASVSAGQPRLKRRRQTVLDGIAL